MSSQSQFNLAQNLSNLPSNVPSLCIPRVFKNITEKRVFENFDFLGLGYINHIEMIPRVSKTGEEYKQVIIHLNWNLSDTACQARHTVMSGNEFKIIYDKDWFWKVSILKDKKQVTNTQIQRINPTIDFTPSQPREQAPTYTHSDEFGRDQRPIHHDQRQRHNDQRHNDQRHNDQRHNDQRHNNDQRHYNQRQPPPQRRDLRNEPNREQFPNNQRQNLRPNHNDQRRASKCFSKIECDPINKFDLSLKLVEPTSPTYSPPRRDIEPTTPTGPPPRPVQIQKEQEQDEGDEDEEPYNKNNYYKPEIGIKTDVDSPIEYPPSIDYGTPLHIPKKNRIIVKKNKLKEVVKNVELEEYVSDVSSEVSEVYHTR